MKKGEKEVTGNQERSEHVEMAGWGVEEADEKNKADASMSLPIPKYALFHMPCEHGRESIQQGIGWVVTEKSGLATQLALAYAIHKSFIFVRVPLTAAVTPKVVKILRSWGWDIGKRTTKEAKALRRASLPVQSKKRRRWMKRRGGNGNGGGGEVP